MKKFVNIISVIGIIVLIWIMASFIDINSNNGVNDNKVYKNWNCFVLIEKIRN